MIIGFLTVISFILGLVIGYCYKGDIKITKTVINKEEIIYTKEDEEKQKQTEEMINAFGVVDDILKGERELK